MSDRVIQSTNSQEVAGNQVIKKKTNSKKNNSSIMEKLFFILVFITLFYGWRLREEEILSAETGWGYWLGIIGGSLMLILMLYPMRKHSKIMRNWGPIRYWFRFHMVLGVLGPIAILFHANFSLGSVNSNVALFAMITVAVSGLVGRYFYSKIHHGLYGQKASLEELQNSVSLSTTTMSGEGIISHGDLLAPLETVQIRLKKAASNYFLGIAMLPSLSIYTFIVSVKLNKSIWELLKVRVQENKLSEVESRSLRRELKAHTKQYLKNICRVVEYIVYERIFSLWHVLHLPLFLIMLATGLFHVYAVHMY